MLSAQPSVGDYFSLSSGERIEVIGYGTGGIVIEYHDGRAELIDQPGWQRMQPQIENSVSEDLAELGSTKAI